MLLVRAVSDVDEIATLLHRARPPPRLPTVAQQVLFVA